MRGNTAANMTMGGYGGGQDYYSDPIEITSPSTEMQNGKVVEKAGAGKAAGMSGGGTAALIALQLYSQAKKAEFADKQNRYKAHLDQRNAMSNALDSLIGTTRSMRL